MADELKSEPIILHMDPALAGPEEPFVMGEEELAMQAYFERHLGHIHQEKKGDELSEPGYVLGPYGVVMPPPGVDQAACPLSTCTGKRPTPPCDACGQPWGHCRANCPDPTEAHDTMALRAEIYRLRAVLAWLDGKTVHELSCKVKALGKAYGRASETIGSLRHQVAAYQLDRRLRAEHEIEQARAARKGE